MTQIISLFAVFLTIFLFGMTVMRLGLNTASKQKLKVLLLRYTDKTWKSFLLGILITAVIQSSSAVMVIVIGLVAAQLMNFRQSIGIILGANIGTTISTEIITFEIDQLILPFLIIGFIMIFQSKNWSFCCGSALFGLGCMFVAMNGFEALAGPITQLEWVQHLLQLTNKHILYGLGLGTTMTAVIQSSTATTAIIMSLMHENILSLTSGIAIMLGANVGTCVTAMIASIGTIHEAKLVAFAHTWINIIGVFLFLPFLNLFSNFVILLTHLPDVQIAHASVLFNVISSLLLLPCAGLLAAIITKLHGERMVKL
ncbi:Na/Pi symporter [Pseudalkalibacillus salsuginis]|uniref:Na/Pi symporter n=1 Tax=Pseudalkalibacillus salsuginis TaxID=2910972 RepID=UPI001F322078|nr:Na/Pi symporter [Pseudalkalibacillus salsuginis]MCF6408538.1 Na/Pi symporter [Pseudalkalibacillus salsuginis]